MTDQGSLSWQVIKYIHINVLFFLPVILSLFRGLNSCNTLYTREIAVVIGRGLERLTYHGSVTEASHRMAYASRELQVSENEV